MAELPDVHTVKMVKGRTAYKCYECGFAILKGSLHEYFRGLWDGKWNTYRTCTSCVGLRNEVVNLSNDSEFQFGELKDDCDYHGITFPPEKEILSG